MHEDIAATLRATAEYIEGTKIPIGEVEAIRRLLGCAETMKHLADSIDRQKEENQNETEDQQGKNV